MHDKAKRTVFQGDMIMIGLADMHPKDTLIEFRKRHQVDGEEYSAGLGSCGVVR